MLRSLVQALAALAVTAGYFSYVFQIPGDSFWHFGIGDWGDPYFINFLLEHWYVSATRFSDPASPPMYFPVEGTLGYSHGLILYAPFYVPARFVLDPFQAHNVSLLAVLVLGSISVYVILREIVGLRFVEALLLTIFFFTSRNVVSPTTAIWSQTASVFLIPPILLLALVARRMGAGLVRAAAAAFAGLLSTLLFTQEFYTAQFALFFVSAMVIAWLAVERRRPISEKVAAFWEKERRVHVRIAVVTAAAALMWALGLIMYGGGVVEVFGVRLASRDWRRPALLAVAAAALLLYRRGRPDIRLDFSRQRAWIPPFCVGALFGICIFLWIYLPIYLEHHAFSSDELILTLHDPSRWRTWNFVYALGAFESLRTFYFAFLIGGLSCLPWFRLARNTRIYCGCFVALSLLVLTFPVRFDTFSVWRTFFAPVPGFAAIRDPKRVIQVYELFLVLLAAGFLIGLPRASRYRLFVSATLLLLILLDWNRDVFFFARPAADYRRWVEAPIDVDPECDSFFIKGASQNYMARWNNPWILYSVDAMFVSLRQSLPTLNGYSAWFPEDWRLFHPHEGGYSQAVTRWIAKHRLNAVCEFDIEKRIMKPVP
jgi:hypothetical protein